VTLTTPITCGWSKPDGALAKLQRRISARQGLPLPRQIIIEAALDTLDRHEFGRNPAIAFDAQ
jgi:hypothetical protein